MRGFVVQIIVFFFSGTILFTGIYIVIGGNIEKTSIITIFFTVGLLLTILAAVNPYEILELTYGKFHLKRHQPAKEEREVAIKISADKPVKIQRKEKEKLIKAAEHRSDQIRSPEDYLVLATEAWREKKYDDALQFAFAGLNLKPDETIVKATLINRIGSIYSDLKIPDLTIKYYKNAMEEDPKFAMPHNNLGVLYDEQKKYSEAKEEYKKAIEIDPEFAMPHFNLGVLYYGQKKYSEAKEEYKKAIEIDPNYKEARENLEILQSLIKNKGGFLFNTK